MIWLWAGFFLLVILLLALDLGVFHRHSHAIGMREALGWTAFWIVLGLAFTVVVYLVYQHHWFGAKLVPDEKMLSPPGLEASVRYLTGYLLEKSLSIDNLFVISVIFSALKVPARHQHRVLFWGIVGALVFRTLFIAGGVWIVHRFAWSFYIFGALLLYSGGKMMLEGDEPPDPEKSWFLRTARRIVPVTIREETGHFTVREGGKRKFTQLALALVAVEAADVVFAVDSVPAILGVTTDAFIVVTSNVFAILGLRSLYFVLANMLARFRKLKYALALLLIVIGVKMLLHSVVKIPNILSLAVVVVIVGAGVLFSIISEKRRSDE